MDKTHGRLPCRKALTLVLTLSLTLALMLSACGEPSSEPIVDNPPSQSDDVPLLPRPTPGPDITQSLPADTKPRFDPEVNPFPDPEPASQSEYKEEPKIIQGPDGKKYLNNQILVKFAGTVTAGQATAFADNYKGTVAVEQPVDGAYRIDLDDPLSYDDLFLVTLRMKTEQTVVDAWLEPIAEFGDSQASSGSQIPGTSEAPPAVVSSEGNVLIYDRSPDIPDIDPYGGSSDGGARG